MNHEQLLQEANSMFEYTQMLRRDFHQNPELGFNEVRTAGIVADELRALNLQVRTGIAQTGVVAVLDGAYPGPILMLRFDMDALPISEETRASYSSKVPGVMHACGHDGHTAIGLTVARLLQSRQSELHGSIKLVFQPAEEGLGGAERMIADGVLTDPRPDIALGLHLWNEKPVGWVSTTPGPLMAAADFLKIEVIGKGGHGAQPHLANDPLVASAQLVMSIQSIVSRSLSPLESAVISLTMIHGGEAFNVIPGQVVLQGTIRTFDSEIRQKVIEWLKIICDGTGSAHNCQINLEVKSLTPAVVNDPDEIRKIRKLTTTLFPGFTFDDNFRTMGSEDMAFFLQEIPGCFVFVGSANSSKGLDSPHHHPAFDFDENVLPIGAALIAGAAMSYLEGQGIGKIP